MLDISYEYWRSIELVVMEDFLNDISYKKIGFCKNITGPWLWRLPVGFYEDVKRTRHITPLYWR